MFSVSQGMPDALRHLPGPFLMPLAFPFNAYIITPLYYNLYLILLSFCEL